MSNHSSQQEQKKDAELKARKNELTKKLAQKETKEIEAHSAKTQDSSAMAQAFRLGTEFIVAIAMGGFIGWGLDKLFSTKPFLLILFLMVGFGAGILNVIRASNQMTSKIDDKGQDIGFDDDEDDER